MSESQTEINAIALKIVKKMLKFGDEVMMMQPILFGDEISVMQRVFMPFLKLLYTGKHNSQIFHFSGIFYFSGKKGIAPFSFF